jgi:hypothetical protein
LEEARFQELLPEKLLLGAPMLKIETMTRLRSKECSLRLLLDRERLLELKAHYGGPLIHPLMLLSLRLQPPADNYLGGYAQQEWRFLTFLGERLKSLRTDDSNGECYMKKFIVYVTNSKTPLTIYHQSARALTKMKHAPCLFQGS